VKSKKSKSEHSKAFAEWCKTIHASLGEYIKGKVWDDDAAIKFVEANTYHDTGEIAAMRLDSFHTCLVSGLNAMKGVKSGVDSD